MSSLPTSIVRSCPAAPSDWISIAEAAARSGIPERTLRRRCQIWRNTARASCVSGEWKIDPRVDEAFLTPVAGDDTRAEVLDLRRVSAGKRAGANRRREVLRDLQAYIARRMSSGGVGRTQAIDEFAAKFSRTGESPGAYGLRFNRATLYRWLGRAKHAPISGLVDRRGLAGGGQEPDADVVHFFEQRWLHPNKPTLRSTYHEVALYCDRTGKDFFGSYATFRRWVKATYPQAKITLNREGFDAYHRKHEPSIDQDPDNFAAGELYVGDHHQFRCMVWYQGRLIRPWLTAWMDQRSLLFVGYCVVPAPNQCTILAAYKHACQRYGPSKMALMDNGRDYSGYAVSGGKSRRGVVLRKGYLDREQLVGLFSLIGVEPRFAIPKRANSKIIEGMFKPIEEDFVRQLPNYCGADPQDRPQAVSPDGEGGFEDRVQNHPEAFPQFDVFAAAVGTWIDTVYSVRRQTGKYCPDQSPAEVFAAKAGSRPQLADPRVLDLFDMVWSQPVRVGRKGVRFRNLLYGAWDPNIIARHGEQVIVSYNPNDIGSIGLWSLDYRFLCRANQNQLADRNATDGDLREALRIRARLKKALTVQREDGYLQFEDNATLALAAQRRAVERDGRGRLVNAEEGRPVRLIQTPLDGQMDRVRAAFQRPAAVDVLPAPDALLERLRDGDELLPAPQPELLREDTTLSALPTLDIEPEPSRMETDDLMKRLSDGNY